jgi:hypothetical protein
LLNDTSPCAAKGGEDRWATQLSLNKEPEKLEAFDDCCANENAFEDDYMRFSWPHLVGAAVRKVFCSTIQCAVAHLILIVLLVAASIGSMVEVMFVIIFLSLEYSLSNNSQERD